MSLKDRLTKLVDAAKETTDKTTKIIAEAYEREETQAALAWAKKTAESTVNEASRIGKEAVRSDMAKDAAAGAAIGAAVAVPIPVVGPIAGAVVGAGLGVYKNFVKPTPKVASLSAEATPAPLPPPTPTPSPEIYETLLKYEDLRQKGILTDEEFAQQKSKLLGGI